MTYRSIGIELTYLLYCSTFPFSSPRASCTFHARGCTHFIVRVNRTNPSPSTLDFPSLHGIKFDEGRREGDSEGQVTTLSGSLQRRRDEAASKEGKTVQCCTTFLHMSMSSPLSSLSSPPRFLFMSKRLAPLSLRGCQKRSLPLPWPLRLCCTLPVAAAARRAQYINRRIVRR